MANKGLFYLPGRLAKSIDNYRLVIRVLDKPEAIS